jgi:hypothetical protein
MNRWIVLLALSLMVLAIWVGQSVEPKSVKPQSVKPQSVESQSAAGMRPVKQLPSETPSSAEISFMDFEFKQLQISRHPGMFPIEGEPTKGSRFFVEATFHREDAIATAKFEAVDEAGNVLQKILIEREPDANGGSGFYGVMKVPDRPFRVVVSGEGIDGRSYRLVHERLFKPTTQPKSAVLIPPGGDLKKRREFEETASQAYMDEKEADLRRSAGEMIVMPRTRVSNVMYAPYLSKAGRPLGVRITFDVEFSQDGYYNPELQLYPNYKKDEWRGRIDMKPLTGSIEPKPEESGSPQIQPHILAYGAGYLYRAGTTYHFTAEYIPNYVVQNEKKTKFCIWYQQYKYSPELEAAWKEILASKAPTKYTLSIRNTDFYGEIDDVPQSTLFKSFLAEGATDCGEQPTYRF